MACRGGAPSPRLGSGDLCRGPSAGESPRPDEVRVLLELGNHDRRRQPTARKIGTVGVVRVLETDRRASPANDGVFELRLGEAAVTPQPHRSVERGPVDNASTNAGRTGGLNVLDAQRAGGGVA